MPICAFSWSSILLRLGEEVYLRHLSQVRSTSGTCHTDRVSRIDYTYHILILTSFLQGSWWVGQWMIVHETQHGNYTRKNARSVTAFNSTDIRSVQDNVATPVTAMMVTVCISLIQLWYHTCIRPKGATGCSRSVAFLRVYATQMCPMAHWATTYIQQLGYWVSLKLLGFVKITDMVIK